MLLSVSIIVLILIKIFVKIKMDFLLFLYTIIFSTIFYASRVPFIGLPQFFLFMCISIVVSYAKNGFYIQEKTYIFLICFSILVSTIALLANLRNIPSILINKSITDTTNIESQLFIPTFNFTIIKHIVFYLMFIIFIDANKVHLKSITKIVKTMNVYKVAFFVFCCALTFEFLFNYAFNIENDRKLMMLLFDLEREANTAQENWVMYGIKTACLNLGERAYYTRLLVPFYLYLLSKKKINNFDFTIYIFSLIGCIVTVSSAAILSAGLFSFFLVIFRFFKEKNWYINIGILTIILLGAFFVVYKSDLLFSKFISFISGDKSPGSSFYRMQSILLALNSFIQAPIFGVGMGTIYCHSGLIETIANMGIAGFVLFFLTLKKYLNLKMNSKTILGLLLIAAVAVGTYTIQEFTSPMLLTALIPLALFNKQRVIVSKFKQKLLLID